MKADLPPPSEIWFHYIHADSNPPWRYLHGNATVETSDFNLSADEIQYNSDTNWAYAQGHVHLDHFVTGDKLNADRGEYNLKTQEGKFYVVNGTSPAKVMTSPGVLTTTSPFFFQAQWAERIKDRYILHHGFVTDCKIPKPWWTFEGPIFDIIPGDRAIARNTVFRLKHIPVFYLPVFYRPLGRNPRRSGFLTPNIGHSSLFGYMVGAGYYWAMNRSYDMTGIVQYFTQRGPAITYDFRGKPNEVTDFNVRSYGVIDRGLPQPGGKVLKEGGEEFEITGRTEIWGFQGRLDYNYLSSYLFRAAFSYSFGATISSQVNSIGYLHRHFKDDAYALNFVMQRDEQFEAITFPPATPNQVIIQKLPSVEFTGRDQQLASGPVPVWFSFGSSAAAMSREETIPKFESGQLMRADIEPRVATAFDFKGFSLTPSITFGATDYSNSYELNSNTLLASANIFRKDADFTVNLTLPTIERVFTPPKWLHLGAKVKHAIETEATYEYVTGIDQFQRIIHFDATDILSNTNQLTISLTNRLYKKDKDGNISEFLTWRLAQARYFDPTFGGAVVAGQRNIVLATAELAPFTFLDGPRSYSPIVSSLTLNPYVFFSIDWRTDYDPLRHKFVDQSLSANARYSKYFVTFSETAISTNPVLVAPANQVGLGGGYGNTNRKGWNAAALVLFDERLNRRLFDLLQATYNTDCCGFSFELRNINLGIRQENEYLFSFSVANIGTFGSLQKQARIF